MQTFSNKKWLLLFFVFSSVLFMGSRPLFADGILIFAASSLDLPLQKISSKYQKTTSNKVRVSTASSSILSRQISQGAPADIYISANRYWMNFLTSIKPMIAQTKRKILSNQLVLISQANRNLRLSSLTIKPISHLLVDSRLAIGDPDHVPVGIYGKQALTHLNLWDSIKHKLAPITNARAVLNLVEKGEASIGIVYHSDTLFNNKVQKIYKFPSHLHEDISYWASLCRSANISASQNFFNFLFSQYSKNIFKQHGFLVD